MTSTEGYEAAGALLRALSAPLRIGIVTELADGARCVHELIAALGVPQPLVSQHLRVLRAAGVVRGSRRGREIEYSLTDEHVAHIVADAVRHAGEDHARTPDHTAGTDEATHDHQTPGERTADHD